MYRVVLCTFMNCIACTCRTVQGYSLELINLQCIVLLYIGWGSPNNAQLSSYTRLNWQPMNRKIPFQLSDCGRNSTTCMRLSCPSSCANDIFVHHPHTLSSSYSTLGPLLNSVEEASIGCMGNRWPPEVKVHTGSSLAAPEGVSLPSWCFRKMSSTLYVCRLATLPAGRVLLGWRNCSL